MAISVADNFQYLGTKPLDARLKFASVSDMVSTAAASLYDGCFAYVTATKKYYSYDSTNTVDVTLGKWREYSSGGDTIQVSSLPTASASELGNVYQYIGSTTLVYTHGYFYECVSDGEGTPTYSWEEVSTSKGGHDIKNDGVAVTARDTMNFTDFDIADDSTNEETDIKAHRLTASELTDICSPLPSVPSDMPILFDERGTEYVVGWYVLSDGTKKPLYQKTLQGTTPASQQIVDVGLPASAKVMSVDGYVVDNDGWTIFVGTQKQTDTENQYFYISNNFASYGSQIWFCCGSAIVNRPYTLTFRYTKSTDTPS